MQGELLLNEVLAGLGYASPRHAAQAGGPQVDLAHGAAGTLLFYILFSCLLWKTWAGSTEL